MKEQRCASTPESAVNQMTPERWRLVKEKLEIALGLEASEQAAYLAEIERGDQELVQELHSLLASHEQVLTDFMDTPAIGDAAMMAVAPPPKSMLGRRVGTYQIVEQIGMGGMGEVYRAFRADDQYRKEVAIKVIRGGQDSAFVVSRFKHERQILADLDHPNIARLLDGGSTEEGVPYFVMELINGQPIDECCRKLTVSARLKLFLQVCSAVEYAHQRLTIHRDIKPGNILVTSDGNPKLLDFGIAKILDATAAQDLGPSMTLFQVLTPGYASPEQIKGEPITTATDVYSLGVVLYELLTGQHPYFAAGDTAEKIARKVCDTEPKKPSSVVRGIKTSPRSSVSASDDGSSGQAAKAEKKLRKRLSGDLDNIVLRALRKEPQRRYPSVEQFAEDIRRHLENLPVSARKDTASYRASKFVRRHKVGIAATAIVVVALLAGMAITLTEKRRADRRFNDVRSLANSLLFEIHDSIRDLPGSTPARKLIVDRALKYLDSLAAEGGNDPALLRELATAYERVGDVQGNPRFANLGDTAGSIASYRKALGIRLALADDKRSSSDDQAALAAIYVKFGFGLRITNDFPAALDAFQRAYPIAERLAAAKRDNPQAQEAFGAACFAMAMCLADMGELTGSLEYYRKSTAIREAITGGSPVFQAYVQTRLAGVYGYMSGVVHLQGNLDTALSLQSKARDILAGQVKSDPQNATLRQFLLQGEYWVGYYLAEKGLPAQALPHYQAALAGYQKLASADSQDALVMRYLGECYMSIGTALAADGKGAQGIQSAHQAVRIFETLASADHADLYFKSTNVAYASSALAGAYSRTAAESGIAKRSKIANWREARSWYQKSLDTWLLLKKKAPLGKFDAAQPDKITIEIAKCDAALAKLNANNP
jgi:serine/threonine protein kinase